MEVTYTTVLGSLLIALLAVATSNGLPSDEGSLSADKRPKYMDTREDFDVFKQTVYLSIQELVEEGKVSPSVLLEDENNKDGRQKRMYMGICMRQSHNHFIPYPCMRQGRK